MTAYYLLYFVIIIFKLFEGRLINNINKLLYFYLVFIIFLFIGLRHEVGGDWFNYTAYINDIKNNPKTVFNFKGDLFFNFILYIFKDFDYSIYYVNLISSFIFVSSLYLYSLQQNKPVMVFVVSFPILILILSMGYTRQSIAFGVLIFSILALNKGKNLSFVFLIIIGSLFHKSLILFIILLIVNFKLKLKYLLVPFFLVVSTMILIYYFKTDTVNYYINTYIGDGQHLESKGALYRYLVNLLPAIIFLLFLPKFSNRNSEFKIMLFFSILTIMGSLTYSYASTFIDRMGFYLAILQLYIFSNLDLIIKDRLLNKITYVVVLFIYFAVLTIWLNFSKYSFTDWTPYKNILFL